MRRPCLWLTDLRRGQLAQAQGHAARRGDFLERRADGRQHDLAQALAAPQRPLQLQAKHSRFGRRGQGDPRQLVVEGARPLHVEVDVAVPRSRRPLAAAAQAQHLHAAGVQRNRNAEGAADGRSEA